MKTVIIGGGSLDADVANSVIGNEECLLIAADRGLDYCRLIHRKPDVAIGDFDSVSTGTRNLLDSIEGKGVKLIRLDPVKDDSDLEAALDYVLENTVEGDIYLLGATGTRLDHVIGNLSLLRLAARHDRHCYIVDRNNRIRLIRDGETVVIKKCEQYGRYVSLLPVFGRCEGVRATGVYYPLDNAIVGDEKYYFTLTISNEITSPMASFSVGKGMLILIEAKD